MNCCYAVLSGKGGVGKTTVTANLGAALAQQGSRVVLIDADIGLRSLDALLSMENRVVYDLIDVARGDCSLSQALIPCESVPGLFLLPAAQFERAKALSPKQLTLIIEDLRQRFDEILIDCPAGIERGLRNVLNAGMDETLLVVTPDDISVRSAERALQLIDAKQAPRPRLIVNQLDTVLIHRREMMSAATVAAVLDLPLLGEIPADQTVYRAMLRHSLLLRYDCEASRAFRRIAARLRGTKVPLPCYGKKGVPVFSRFRSLAMREVIPLDNH